MDKAIELDSPPSTSQGSPNPSDGSSPITEPLDPAQLRNSMIIKEDGLYKRTISITVDGITYHLVAYYKAEDQINLRRPKNVPELAVLSNRESSSINVKVTSLKYPKSDKRDRPYKKNQLKSLNLPKSVRTSDSDSPALEYADSPKIQFDDQYRETGSWNNTPFTSYGDSPCPSYGDMTPLSPFADDMMLTQGDWINTSMLNPSGSLADEIIGLCIPLNGFELESHGLSSSTPSSSSSMGFSPNPFHFPIHNVSTITSPTGLSNCNGIVYPSPLVSFSTHSPKWNNTLHSPTMMAPFQHAPFNPSQSSPIGMTPSPSIYSNSNVSSTTSIKPMYISPFCNTSSIANGIMNCNVQFGSVISKGNLVNNNNGNMGVVPEKVKIETKCKDTTSNMDLTNNTPTSTSTTTTTATTATTATAINSTSTIPTTTTPPLVTKSDLEQIDTREISTQTDSSLLNLVIADFFSQQLTKKLEESNIKFKDFPMMMNSRMISLDDFSPSLPILPSKYDSKLKMEMGGVIGLGVGPLTPQ